MTPREFRSALALLGLMVVAVAGVGGYWFVYSPLQNAHGMRQQLQKDIDDLELQLMQMLKDRGAVAEVQRQSLPPDDTIAQAQYAQLLERLLLQAGIRDFKFSSVGIVQARPPIIPEVAPKRPAYKQHRFVINIENVNLWQLVDFLYAYYQLDLLHQISSLRIERNERDPSRNGLKVTITSDAIAVDGVKSRTSLFPVTNVVAAVAGNLGLQLLQKNPEQTRLLQWTRAEPVLAFPPRDYRYIVQNDIFYGVLPPYMPKKPVPFAMAPLPDVTLRRDGKPYVVRVRLSGDGSEDAEISATVTGSLIAEEALEVDNENWTITLPAVGPDTPDSATSTVTVTAVSADGVEVKRSFRVSLEPPATPPAPPKPDIAWLITLPIVSTGSDGTAQAIIKDHFNNFRYVISATSTTITVRKEIPWTARSMKEDANYRRTHPPGLLVISDEGTSATSRTFRVVAIDEYGIILADARPTGKTEGAAAGRGNFGGRGNPARQGPADPLAALLGNPATLIPRPVYYRWEHGKSLKDTLEKGQLKAEEIDNILRRIAVTGTVVLRRLPEDDRQ
ncbi:MAG: type II secretion system protein M [Gemmataceae bacterium]|nr:type II secretion system protein M [Gemmataceae bacterium]